jgi:uncharacterized LabA/DUF88 family protein
MNRFAIFVDAGYLFAASGKLCFDVTDRRRLALNARTLCPELATLAQTNCGLEYLRTYWYDGARDARPTPQHVDVANLPGVKVRLGRLVRYGQKGVDSRIVRDLIILSVERAVATAYLLGGDEDLREGVAEAQERGVRVVLAAIEPLDGQNLSPTLAMEVDDILTLDRAFVEPHIALREEQAHERYDLAQADDPQAIGREFGTIWWERSPLEERHSVRRGRPRIPAELDRRLLAAATRLLGANVDEEARAALRRGFWQVVDGLAGGGP